MPHAASQNEKFIKPFCAIIIPTVYIFDCIIGTKIVWTSVRLWYSSPYFTECISLPFYIVILAIRSRKNTFLFGNNFSTAWSYRLRSSQIERCRATLCCAHPLVCLILIMPFLRSTSSQSSKRASLVRIPVLSSSLKNTGICILLSLKSKSEILTGLRSNMVALKKLASSSSVKYGVCVVCFHLSAKKGERSL